MAKGEGAPRECVDAIDPDVGEPELGQQRIQRSPQTLNDPGPFPSKHFFYPSRVFYSFKNNSSKCERERVPIFGKRDTRERVGERIIVQSEIVLGFLIWIVICCGPTLNRIQKTVRYTQWSTRLH